MKSIAAPLGPVEQPASLFCATQSGLVCGALTLTAVFSFTGISLVRLFGCNAE
jgi:hypothetical protein